MPSRRMSVLLAALLVVVATPTPASGVISTATTIDGPSADVRSIGDVAVSQDGTGGLVYLKRVDGRDHVFVSQFVGGVWQAARQVDLGQRFDSSWPAVGAADGGQLVVVWVQEFGAADRMYSASLQPGARRFGPVAPVDLNVGDAAQPIAPSVSLNRGGQGYVAYRVVTDPQPASARAGDVLGEIRVARYNGQFWSGFGSPLNRNPAAPLATPSPANAPRIGTDLNGNAVIAWQEADDDFVDRVYARRVFGQAVGIAQQVSPATLMDKPVRGAAEQFALSVGPYGRAAVAWRQLASPGGPFATARVLEAELPDVFSTNAAAFGAARVADGGGTSGSDAVLGDASIAISKDRFSVAFGQDAAAEVVGGDDATVDPRARLDAGTGIGDPQPRIELADSGATAYAWRVNDASGRGAVRLRELRSDGVPTDAALSGSRGGTVSTLLLAGSGLGDALVTWQQGQGAFTQIAAGVIDAPPDVFNLQVPLGWVRTTPVQVAWDPALHAIGGVRYAVTVDDDEVLSDQPATTATLKVADLDDGVHTVQVIAQDGAGQETASVPAQLKLDRRPPRVSISARGRTLSVRVKDGGKGAASGVDAGATRIAFGDGRHARGRTRVLRAYRRPGRFGVVVAVRDKVGNATTVRRRVQVR